MTALLERYTYELEAEYRRRRSQRIDPLARVLDPRFTAVSWEYEPSRTDPMIPGKLHPKQLEALQADAKHRWLFWGNQVGKTTVGAIDVALLALGRHPYLQKWEPPITAWASALTWELWEKILLPELLTWIPTDRLVDAPPAHQHSTKRDILVTADNGKISRITGKAAEQGADKYQSARVHIVWLDEEHPEAVWDEMQPRLLRHGGITLATMTPLKGMTWVYGRVYEPWKSGRTDPSKHWCSHAGLSDNPSIRPDEIADLTAELRHNPSQLAARLSGYFVRPSGAVLPFDAQQHLVDLSTDQLHTLIATGECFGGIDLGLWRFAFLLIVVDRDGHLFLIDEVFSQREDTDVRARKIDRLLKHYDVPESVTIRADCADPEAIRELNAALDRLKSPYFIGAVDARNKIIRVGVERLENLMNRGAFFVRRGIGNGSVWHLGMNASRAGTPVEGSRWLWEVNNWQYPKTIEGKIQKDEPDDTTADGADCMDATRYVAMTYWAAQEARQTRAPASLEEMAWAEQASDDLDPWTTSTDDGHAYHQILND